MKETWFDFPFHVDGRGRAAETDRNDHVRDMIWQVLFTSPGERVNRPDFGCGINQLVFAPNSEQLAAATQFLALGALTRWLADDIVVHEVAVAAQDNALVVTVSFSDRRTGEQRSTTFQSPWHP
jgi:phage baseplate assembly protein W